MSSGNSFPLGTRTPRVHILIRTSFSLSHVLLDFRSRLLQCRVVLYLPESAIDVALILKMVNCLTWLTAACRTLLAVKMELPAAPPVNHKQIIIINI